MRNRARCFLVLFIIILSAFLLSCSPLTKVSAKDKYIEKSNKVTTKIDENSYNPAGIILENVHVKAGDSLIMVWGVFGPPDRIASVRGKDNPQQDYVKLSYDSYGVSIDISNKMNVVQGIMVSQESESISLYNCPFKIGENVNIVLGTWGEPEKKMENIYAYWKRGVYVGISPSGIIQYFFITAPGRFDDENR